MQRHTVVVGKPTGFITVAPHMQRLSRNQVNTAPNMVNDRSIGRSGCTNVLKRVALETGIDQSLNQPRPCFRMTVPVTAVQRGVEITCHHNPSVTECRVGAYLAEVGCHIINCLLVAFPRHGNSLPYPRRA